MIVPSIDLMGGVAVQLEQGSRKKLERPDPLALADELALYGELNVIDLDRALGRGENDALVRAVCARAPCNVGGGVRTPERAVELLRAGARRVVIGSAAFREGGLDLDALAAFGRAVPRDRLVVAVDARDGKVVTHGWTRTTDVDCVEAAKRLGDVAGNLLFTAVEREGLMGGTDLARARAVRAAFAGELYVAGGIATHAEVRDVLALGGRPVLGMALYTGKIDPVEAFVGALEWDKRGGLLPTAVRDEDGVALLSASSSPDSLRAALRERRGVYFSTSRGEVWRKGDTSGHVQRLLRARFDCDRDALLFTVRQEGGACHTGRYSCFGDERDDALAALARTIRARAAGGGSAAGGHERDLAQRGPASPRERAERATEGDRPSTSTSYTARLLADRDLALAKLAEEAGELADAIRGEDRAAVTWELADVLYHALVAAAGRDVHLEDALAELRGRQRP